MTGFASSPESGLWAEFAGPLRAFVARRVPAGIDPDDVVQDVFLRVMRHLGSFKSHATLSTRLPRDVTACPPPAQLNRFLRPNASRTVFLTARRHASPALKRRQRCQTSIPPSHSHRRTMPSRPRPANRVPRAPVVEDPHQPAWMPAAWTMPK